MPQQPGEAVQPVIPQGQADYQRLLSDPRGGQDVADAYYQTTAQKLADGGMKPSEIASYFGRTPAPAPSLKNLGDRIAYGYQQQGQSPTAQVASTPWQEFQAGWGNTGVGRIVSGGDPRFVTNPHSGLWGSLANVAGGTLGDIGPSIAGSIGGGAAAGTGGIETGFGDIPIAALGAGAGASAAPTALRHAVIDAQDKGQNLDAGAIAGQVIDTVKDGVIGSLTLGAGRGVGKTVLDKTGSKLFSTAAELTTQAVTQTVMSAGAQGRLPTTQDFTAAVVGVVGTHAAFAGGGKLSSAAQRVQKNMQEIYKQTGITPQQQAAAAAADPAYRAELLQQDVHGNPVAPLHRAVAPDEASFAGKPTQGSTPVASTPEYQGGVSRMLGIIGGNEHSRIGDPDTAKGPETRHGQATGYYQIMDGTARQYGFDPTRLTDHAYNQQAATTIIGDLYRKSGGDEAATLIGYNAGPGRMHEYLNSDPGTRLEAVRDPSQHGGWRYETVKSMRDESFLPLETQKYVAQGRVRGSEKGGSALASGSGEEGAAAPTPTDVDVQAETLSRAASSEETERTEQADRDVKDAEAEAGGGKGGGNEGGEGQGEEPVGPQKMDVGDAYDKIGEMIAPEQKQSVVGGLLKLMSPSKLYEQFVSTMGNARDIDNLIAKNEGKPTPNQWTSEDAIRNTFASEQRAVTMLRPIITDASKAVKANGGDEASWAKWMLAVRSNDKRMQGVETGFDPDASFTLATDADEAAKYAGPTQRLQDGWNQVLDEGQKGGLWTLEQVQRMKDTNPVYLAMKRDMTPGLAGGRSAIGASDPLRKLTGSDEQVVDPLHSTFRNAVNIIAARDRNEAAQFFVDAHERGALLAPDGTSLLTKIATLDKARVLTPETNEDTGENELNPEFGFVAHKLGANEFALLRDGKREIYKVSDTKSIDGASFASLVRGADSPGQANILIATAEKMANLERSGIIGDPTFPIHVQLLHVIQAFIADPQHPFPGVNLVKGMKDAMSMGTANETPTLRSWLMNGGGGAELWQMDTHALDRNISDILGETGALQKLNDMNPLMAYRAMALRAGVASRIGYYKGQVAKGVDPAKAAMQSRTAFVDYSERAGLQMMNTWAKVVPFMRPTTLIADNIGRAIANAPIKTSLYSLAALTVPTIALGIINRLQDQTLPDGQKYSDIPEYEKDTSLILPSVAGWRARVPLPKQLAMVFAGLPNRAMDMSLDGDKDAFKDWGWKFLQSWVPPTIPTAIEPIEENITGHNNFTGRPLIPGSVEKLSGPMQYTDSTSYTARKIDSVMGPAWKAATGQELSPIQLDNVVKGYSGPMGQSLIAALDVPLRAADKSVVPEEHGVFNREASILLGSLVMQQKPGSAKAITEFYDHYKEFETASADKSAAIERAMSGDPSDLAVLQDKSMNPEAYVKLTQVTQSMRTIRMAINAIGEEKDMSVDEKRQRVDQLYGDMISVAKAGNLAIDAVRAAKDNPHAGELPDVNATLGAQK